jgi:hypothetical protein
MLRPHPERSIWVPRGQNHYLPRWAPSTDAYAPNHQVRQPQRTYLRMPNRSITCL